MDDTRHERWERPGRLPGERRPTRDEACRRAGVILAAALAELAEAHPATTDAPTTTKARTGPRRAAAATDGAGGS